MPPPNNEVQHLNIQLVVPAGDAGANRVADALEAASRYARQRQEREPVLTEAPDTTRYAWADLAIQFATAAHHVRPAQ